MKLFRGMTEDIDGLPKTGPGGRLGSSTWQFSFSRCSRYESHDFVFPGQGGMSVTPHDPANLPRHRRPKGLGGIGPDPVWYIELDELGPDLVFRQNSSVHGVVEPARPMTLQEFQNALATTHSRWQVHCR